MRVLLLRSALSDLNWLRAYYSSVFPEGERRAIEQLNKIIALLEMNPYLGKPGTAEGSREFHIPKTPFTLIYRVTEKNIEIARIWDERQGAFD